MKASLKVKGRRLGAFLLEVNGSETKVTGLDEQDDINSEDHASNLTADLRDAFADERTASTPNEIHMNIIKEILKQRGESSLIAPATSSSDPKAQEARDAAIQDKIPSVEHQAELKRQQELMGGKQPGPDNVDKKGTTQADPLLNANPNKPASIDQNLKKQGNDPLLK